MSEFIHSEDLRKNRILDAALVEFAEKGYKKGSTNTIVRTAEVSKGLLFHYFGSKKQLFIYLYQYAMSEITKELFERVNLKDRDVLNRVKTSALSKIQSYEEHELFVKFFDQVKEVKDEEILLACEIIAESESSNAFKKLFENIDYYLFKDSINITRCLKVIAWTLEKSSAEWRKKYQVISDEALEELRSEMDHYLELFKEAFYR